MVAKKVTRRFTKELQRLLRVLSRYGEVSAASLNVDVRDVGCRLWLIVACRRLGHSGCVRILDEAALNHSTSASPVPHPVPHPGDIVHRRCGWKAQAKLAESERRYQIYIYRDYL